MTTYLRRQYDDPGDWFDLHGEPRATPAPIPEHCPTHGDYHPASLIDGDCPTCRVEIDARMEAEHARAAANWWRTPDRAEQADAYLDAHD